MNKTPEAYDEFNIYDAVEFDEPNQDVCSLCLLPLRLG